MDIFKTIGSSWLFWVILIGIIGFIVYSGLKKRKSDKIEKQKRENEVRNLIKERLKTKNNLSNVIVQYLDVRARQGALYKDRDVYDVFLDIKNPRSNKTITKKAYEIEGFAKPKKDDENEYVVNWKIHREFAFAKHQKLLNQSPSSLFMIYLRSLFKRHPREYIQQQKRIRETMIREKAQLDEELVKTPNPKSVFVPKPKKIKEK